ncbi:Lrp/AsnC family transcriptional regulator [Halalkalicoccus salilacus]|uniref:Lrp/AsnC family transcriptional regulator n=1 Tax=Halalkalicoccus TaxID=332246 RepID=UPI002F9648FC
MVRKHNDTYTLDTIDQGILYELQLDARNTTHEEISEELDVSPSTIRNRITKLEAADIIETYVPQTNYERAGFPLRVQFVCTAAPEIRSCCAQKAIELHGVIRIDETITSEQNLCIEVVALDTQDLATITQHLTKLDLQINSSEIITKTYTKPFTYFERAEEHVQSQSQSRREESPEGDAE